MKFCPRNWYPSAKVYMMNSISGNRVLLTWPNLMYIYWFAPHTFGVLKTFSGLNYVRLQCIRAPNVTITFSTSLRTLANFYLSWVEYKACHCFLSIINTTTSRKSTILSNHAFSTWLTFQLLSPQFCWGNCKNSSRNTSKYFSSESFYFNEHSHYNF